MITAQIVGKKTIIFFSLSKGGGTNGSHGSFPRVNVSVAKVNVNTCQRFDFLPCGQPWAACVRLTDMEWKGIALCRMNHVGATNQSHVLSKSTFDGKKLWLKRFPETRDRYHNFLQT